MSDSHTGMERVLPLDRRRPSAELLMLVQEVQDSQTEMSRKMDEVPANIAAALAVLMKNAFPKGDPDGHRKHHEALIKAAEEKAEFWKKMRYEITRWGLMGFLGWALWTLGDAAVIYLQQGPHK